MHLIDPSPRRIAVISAHTSPLGRLGGHKTGGMNVYVRETAVELARLGHLVDIFTRDDGDHPEIVARYKRLGIPVDAAPAQQMDKPAAALRAPQRTRSPRDRSSTATSVAARGEPRRGDVH